MYKEAGLLKITIAIFFIVGITTAYKGKPAATVSSPSIAMTLRDEMPYFLACLGDICGFHPCRLGMHPHPSVDHYTC